ncbi:MAG: hypothetical protein IRY91_05910 [Gemmatimonadaceae bacterium]|nr:hypothetical protein [Gemmatimonadaceae bacterium]
MSRWSVTTFVYIGFTSRNVRAPTRTVSGAGAGGVWTGIAGASAGSASDGALSRATSAIGPTLRTISTSPSSSRNAAKGTLAPSTTVQLVHTYSACTSSHR